MNMAGGVLHTPLLCAPIGLGELAILVTVCTQRLVLPDLASR